LFNEITELKKMFNFPNALLPPSNLLCEVRTIVIDSRSPKKNIPEKKI